MTSVNVRGHADDLGRPMEAVRVSPTAAPVSTAISNLSPLIEKMIGTVRSTRARSTSWPLPRSDALPRAPEAPVVLVVQNEFVGPRQEWVVRSERGANIP